MQAVPIRDEGMGSQIRFLGGEGTRHNFLCNGSPKGQISSESLPSSGLSTVSGAYSFDPGISL